MSQSVEKNVADRISSTNQEISTSATNLPSIELSIVHPNTVDQTVPSQLSVEYSTVAKQARPRILPDAMLSTTHQQSLDLDIDNLKREPNSSTLEHPQLLAWVHEIQKEKLPFSEWSEKKNWEKERLERL